SPLTLSVAFSIITPPTNLSCFHYTTLFRSITTAVTSGSAQTVSLSASGVPAGATASLDPTSVTAGASSTLTLGAGSAPPGTYTITVTGTGASATHSTTVSLTVTAPPPPNAFSLTANPTSVSVQQGSSGSSTISTAVTSGSAQTIALDAGALPSGVTAAFNPASVTAGGTSTLTLTVGTGTASGTYTITVT